MASSKVQVTCRSEIQAACCRIQCRVIRVYSYEVATQHVSTKTSEMPSATASGQAKHGDVLGSLRDLLERVWARYFPKKQPFRP